MKKTICLLCFVLCGCISEYLPKGIDRVADILVVEGIITDHETRITLSRSMSLIDADNEHAAPNYVNGAGVYVECDDGTQMAAEPQHAGTYLVQTGKLNIERKYRLKIELTETDHLHGQTKTNEYCSTFSHPVATSEIDSIFRMKKGKGEPVTIHVSTQSSSDFDENTVLYYLWSYIEEWESSPLMPNQQYPSVCWYEAVNNDLLLGSASKTVSGNLIDNVVEIDPSDSKLSEMYRITVKQNAISKKAYDYFTNIKKNAQQTGSLFSPIPLEITGNITCTTDPDIPVIGYVDVSTTTSKQLYISRRDNLYEPPRWDCQPLTAKELLEIHAVDVSREIPPDYTIYQAGMFGNATLYIKKSCVECNGVAPKPDDWPN